MKNLRYTTLCILLITFCFVIKAEVPSGISYQAVVRGADGELVRSATVSFRISIQAKVKTTTNDLYVETHSTITNENGLATIVVGRGTPVPGAFPGVFSDINWDIDMFSHYLKVETDPTGGTDYTLTGTNQIFSTPYSFLSNEALTVRTETDPVFDASAASQITTTDVNNWNSISLDDAYDISRIIIVDNGPFELLGNDGAVFRGEFGQGNDLTASNSGSRMFWFPKKSAFRAGTVLGDKWNESNLGNYSIAFGYNTMASGIYSTAMGSGAVASGASSTAMGAGEASGEFASAMGSGEASGDYAVAMGSLTEATLNAALATGYKSKSNGLASTAMGNETTASGGASTALGNLTVASGDASLATGHTTIASGLGSTAMGVLASTNSQPGSFVIGDASTYGVDNAVVSNSAANQMMMRFAGGYIFYTNSATSIGVSLAAGGNSWTSISDSTKKENFLPANGEYFLGSLSELKLGSWNYKGQSPEQYRHYGPMAQEIYRYFGNDGMGTIGNDTTLAAADIDGIVMICLQALEQRTAQLKAKTAELDEANKRITNIEERLVLLEKLYGKMLDPDISALTTEANGN